LSFDCSLFPFPSPPLNFEIPICDDKAGCRCRLMASPPPHPCWPYTCLPLSRVSRMRAFFYQPLPDFFLRYAGAPPSPGSPSFFPRRTYVAEMTAGPRRTESFQDPPPTPLPRPPPTPPPPPPPPPPCHLSFFSSFFFPVRHNPSFPLPHRIMSALFPCIEFDFLLLRFVPSLVFCPLCAIFGSLSKALTVKCLVPVPFSVSAPGFPSFDSDF